MLTEPPRSHRLQTVPSLRLLLTLAWPIVLARASQAVVGFADALMVAPLGEASLAAVTTGAMNTLAVLILPMGTVFILQSFAAQLRGRRELSAVRRYGWYGLGLAALAGVLSAGIVPIVPAILARLDYEPAVEREMALYISIRLLSVGAATGTEALGNWYGGLGNTRVALVVGLVTMVVNVAGNWLLIEPRFGLPGYGVAGAAWASVFASWVGLAVVAVAFWRGAWAEGVPRTVTGLRIRELGRVLRFGLPNGVNWFLEFAAFALFINVVVAHLGTTVLAAFNVMLQINSISFMPALGVSSAGAILVGEAIGRGAHDEVWPFVRLTAIVAVAWMVSVGLCYLLAPEALAGMFRPREGPSERFVAIASTMLALAVIWQVFDALGITLSEALRAAGDTSWCMWARIALAWLVFTPAATFTVIVLGGRVISVMVALTLYIAVLAAVLAYRFATGRWRTIDLVGAQPEPV